jgi:hypothetical protein
MAHLEFTLQHPNDKIKYENIKLTCLTSKLYDKITKRPSKFHETIPLIFFLTSTSTVFQSFCPKPFRDSFLL